MGEHYIYMTGNDYIVSIFNFQGEKVKDRHITSSKTSYKVSDICEANEQHVCLAVESLNEKEKNKYGLVILKIGSFEYVKNIPRDEETMCMLKWDQKTMLLGSTEGKILKLNLQTLSVDGQNKWYSNLFGNVAFNEPILDMLKC